MTISKKQAAIRDRIQEIGIIPSIRTRSADAVDAGAMFVTSPGLDSRSILEFAIKEADSQRMNRGANPL